jgi:hypothetical protein
MSAESRMLTVLIEQKILLQFKRFEKNFTEKSKSVFLDEMGEKISLRKIYNLESVNNGPISMIAVTRHQYDVDEFSKYVDYIKNRLKFSTVYYGLWPGVNKVEYDVLYVINTVDHDTIQKHLNAHDFLNDGISQKMALVINHEGTTKIIENSRYANMKCPRCNVTLEKNHPWQECYECIRTVYPET